MRLATRLALKVPAIRRVYDERNDLRRRLAEALDRQGNGHLGRYSPFWHFNASFDPEAVVRGHAGASVTADPDYLTNFLGVKIHPRYFPGLLDGRGGEVEDVPVPANWHADLAEWGAALRAVDLARGSFTVMELGCGWGCWLNNTGVAARRRGLDVRLIGVEGDRDHVAFGHEATAVNGFAPAQVALHHGLATARSGAALFPRQETGGSHWGLEAVFDPDAATRARLLAAGTHYEIPMRSLEELSAGHERIDLLHIDIQGEEAALVAATLDVLARKVAYIVIGTHSRQIEGALFDTLLPAGWLLEIERPALLAIEPGGPRVTVDGVQGWRNPRLLPA